MKKLFLAACALGCAVSVFGQGEVIFYNFFSDFRSHVYGPNASNAGLVQTGNGANDISSGTTDWSAASGWSGLLGTGFTAQLWAAPGANQAESSLQPLAITTTFQTVAAGAGVLKNAGSVPIPNAPEGSIATLELRVWDNQGGTITSYAAAVAAGAAVGSSPIFNSQPLGLVTVTVPELIGLQSFNIHAVPEPSTFALAGLGAAALLIFRRRK